MPFCSRSTPGWLRIVMPTSRLLSRDMKPWKLLTSTVVPRSIEKAPEKTPLPTTDRLPVTALFSDPFDERSVPAVIWPWPSKVKMPSSVSAFRAGSSGMSNEAERHVPVTSA